MLLHSEKSKEVTPVCVNQYLMMYYES